MNSLAPSFSNPTRPNPQASENTTVTTTGKPSGKSEKQILSKSCFSGPEMNSDLKLIIEKWPKLSVELQRAIVKMVQ